MRKALSRKERMKRAGLTMADLEVLYRIHRNGFVRVFDGTATRKRITKLLRKRLIKLDHTFTYAQDYVFTVQGKRIFDSTRSYVCTMAGCERYVLPEEGYDIPGTGHVLCRLCARSYRASFMAGLKKARQRALETVKKYAKREDGA